MLKGIHPAISPELLASLSEMGHGDEILFADAHFPAHTLNKKVIRADGVKIDTLLAGVMPLFELDQFVDIPVIMMAPVSGDVPDLDVEKRYLSVINAYSECIDNAEKIERFAFYDRAALCSVIVLTGEAVKYGNIILKKGVIEGE